MLPLLRPLFSFSSLSPSVLSSLPSPASRRILVTGGCGQLGTEILPYLNHLYKPENVLVTDTKLPSSPSPQAELNNFEALSILDKQKLEQLVRTFKPTYIIHFAAILSANGERSPKACLDVNVNGFKNVLDVACENKIPMFSPSTIAAFGSSTPRMNTPNTTIMRPSTVYGCTKVFNELLGTYYKSKYGMDFRSIRYPQVISCTEASGGSGDYSIEIFYAALRSGVYNSYLKEDTGMSFVYINDLIEGTLKLIETDPAQLSDVVYNLQSCSFTVAQLAAEIRKHIPLKLTVNEDFRQHIVDTWPQDLDITKAEKDWGYSPKYDIKMLTREMVQLVGERVNLEKK